MPHQIKGKSLSLAPKIIALDIEIIKIGHNNTDQKPDDEPAKQHFQVFRWFKFTLKPPYSIAHDKLRLAIWDTSFWTFWLKFGHKGP